MTLYFEVYQPLTLETQDNPGHEMCPKATRIKYNPQGESEPISQTVSLLPTRPIRCYHELHHALQVALDLFDLNSEIDPEPTRDLTIWDGKLTIISQLSESSLTTLVNEVLSHHHFSPQDPLQKKWELEIQALNTTQPPQYKVTLMGATQGQLNFNQTITLPVHGDQDSWLKQVAEADTIEPVISDEFIQTKLEEMKEKEAFNAAIQNTLIQPMSSTKKWATDVLRELNQTDWHQLFRSLGPATTAAGIFASITTGPLGFAFTQAGHAMTAIGGAATYVDHRDEIHARVEEFVEELGDLIRSRITAAMEQDQVLNSSRGEKASDDPKEETASGAPSDLGTWTIV